MSARKDRRAQGGFSFIEVLVGVVILGIVAGGVLMGFTTSSAQTARSKMDTIATKLASGRLDQIRNMDYDNVGMVGGNPDGTIAATDVQVVNGIRYKFALSVAYVDDQAPGRARNYINYKKVAVTVTPDVPVGKPTTQTTLIAPPNAGAIKGKATAIISVVDSVTGDPIPGVSVKLYGSTSPDRTDNTGADGRVVFAGLDPSDPNATSSKYYYYASATAMGYETDPDSVPANVKQSLAASQTWNATIKLYKPAFIKVNVLDNATGALITERTQVKVSLPAPQAISETFLGYTGQFDIPTISGQKIIPSLTPSTVAVDADCYSPGTMQSPVPVGYPANTTQVFNVKLDRIEHTGRLRVWVKQGTPPTAAVPTAAVQVTGGEAGITISPRRVDANGYVDFCLPKSTSTLYTVSAWDTATGTQLRPTNIVTAVPEAGTVDQVIGLLTDATKCQISIQHRLGKNRLIRIVGVNVPTPYPDQVSTNQYGVAVFGNLSPGTYAVFYQDGFAGNLTWVSGGNVPGLVNGNINCPSTVTPVVG